MPFGKVTTLCYSWIYFQGTAISFKIRDSLCDFRNNIYYDPVKVIGKLFSRPSTEKQHCVQRTTLVFPRVVAWHASKIWPVFLLSLVAPVPSVTGWNHSTCISKTYTTVSPDPHIWTFYLCLWLSTVLSPVPKHLFFFFNMWPLWLLFLQIYNLSA